MAAQIEMREAAFVNGVVAQRLQCDSLWIVFYRLFVLP